MLVLQLLLLSISILPPLTSPFSFSSSSSSSSSFSSFSLSAHSHSQSHSSTLGAPPSTPPDSGPLPPYQTSSYALTIAPTTTLHPSSSSRLLDPYITALDARRGVVLTSTYQTPNRYSRWSTGVKELYVEVIGRVVVVPLPLPHSGFKAQGSECTVRALNLRGDVLIDGVVRGLVEDFELKQSEQSEQSEQSGQSVVKFSGRSANQKIDVVVRRSTLKGAGAEREIFVRMMGQQQTNTTNETGGLEEDRTRSTPGLMSIVRSLISTFAPPSASASPSPNINSASAASAPAIKAASTFGLYGALGYDLAFEFQPEIPLTRSRKDDDRTMVFYIPEEVIVIDLERKRAWTTSFEVTDAVTRRSTTDYPKSSMVTPPAHLSQPFVHAKDAKSKVNVADLSRDTVEGGFAKSVTAAKEKFINGDLFEAVLSQTFAVPLPLQLRPSTLFTRLRKRNPSPYGFLLNLGGEGGNSEYLVGASPEMFVRVEKTFELPIQATGSTTSNGPPPYLRVETCPISGTVARGRTALEDSEGIERLLASEKEKSELTMCTDVDRNDKSRICVPGSVQLLSRRSIELYSKVIHTVDHVVGVLREGFDGLDALLAHTWAVTVTGAPKTRAMAFVEEKENSNRAWYGGGLGFIGFDGTINTGLTLRTVRIKAGVAEVRAGATLLFDSEPELEERETELKASAMIDAIFNEGGEKGDGIDDGIDNDNNNNNDVGKDKQVLLIDHDDSFVHTLGNYLRQTGAKVSTIRHTHALGHIRSLERKPDLVVLSPGPGNPKEFKMDETIDLLMEEKIPAFGVCLGLQGMVERFGGELGVLDIPVHGKPSTIVKVNGGGNGEENVLKGVPDKFTVARYHSLYGIREKLPDCLECIAETEDGVVMAIKHKTLPFSAVQYHPESILTESGIGLRILQNALVQLRYSDADVKEGGDGD